MNIKKELPKFYDLISKYFTKDDLYKLTKALDISASINIEGHSGCGKSLIAEVLRNKGIRVTTSNLSTSIYSIVMIKPLSKDDILTVIDFGVGL